MAEGYIYIMTNPCLHDMVKIGYASDVEARRKQLSTTALPFEYEIYATYETSGQLEDKKLHELIDTLNPKLRNVSAIQGTSVFTYNGKKITDIAEETQWMQEKTNEKY